VGILLVVLVAVSLVAVASNPPVGIIIALVSAIIAAAVLSNKT